MIFREFPGDGACGAVQILGELPPLEVLAFGKDEPLVVVVPLMAQELWTCKSRDLAERPHSISTLSRCLRIPILSSKLLQSPVAASTIE